MSFWSRRLYIPPLQAFLTWQSMSLFWLCGLLSARFSTASICCAALIFCLDKRLWNKLHSIFCISLFVLGFLAIDLLVPHRPAYPTWALENQKPKFTRIEATVYKVESLTNRRLRIFLENAHVLDKPSQSLSGLVMWTLEAAKAKASEDKTFIKTVRPQVGQKVQISARLHTTEGFKNFGSNDFGFYWKSQNVFWRIWSRGNYGNPYFFGEANTLARLRDKPLQVLEEHLFSNSLPYDSIVTQARAFLPALLFGEKFYISDESMHNMRAASLVHSLALSGQHLAVVGFFAFIFTSIIYAVFPKILLILPHSKCIGLISIPLAVLYLWLGNAPASLLRAAIMLLMAFIFLWRSKIATLSDILLLTLLLITCYDPTAIFNVGLQLSVLCVASISLVIPLLRRIPIPNALFKQTMPFRYFMAKFARGALQIFIISLTIQVVLLPIFAYYFSPSGPWFISNILWLPILGLWVLPMAVLGLVLVNLWPMTEFSTQVLYLAAWPCEILLQCLDVMRKYDLFNFPAILRPHFSVYLAWGLICISLALLIGRVKGNIFSYKFKANAYKPSRIILVLALSLLFVGPVTRYAKNWLMSDAQIDLLDVGQGQAVCITFKGGQRILIDGGGSMSPRFDTGADLIIPSLSYNTAPRIWAVISTHPDMDHLRGLLAVLEKMQVEKFYHNGKSMNARDAKRLKAMQDKIPPTKILYEGMQLEVPSIDNAFTLDVLNPPQKNNFSDNDASIVLRLKHKDYTQGIAMLCADAEKPAQYAMLNAKQNLSANILLLAHHGSKDAMLPSFYDAIAPQIALVSAGRRNNFAFPHKEVIKELSMRNVKIYSTSNYGAIRVHWQNISEEEKKHTTQLIIEKSSTQHKTLGSRP